MHDTLTAVAWQRRLGMGGRAVPLSWGEAIVTADLPSVFDQNVVWVRRPVDPAQVVEVTEQLAVEAGWRHRTVEVSDPALVGDLRPALVAAGYSESRNVTMVLRDDGPPRSPDDARDDVTAVVSIADQQALARALLAEEPWADSAVILDQFAEREARLADVTGARAVVAPAAAAVSRGLLLSDGGLFEIDAVMTLSQHRGQGWSAAVMRRAIRVGVGTGRPVVLVADESDWPLRWYERLGFRATGVLTVFRRWPGVS